MRSTEQTEALLPDPSGQANNELPMTQDIVSYDTQQISEARIQVNRQEELERERSQSWIQDQFENLLEFQRSSASLAPRQGYYSTGAELGHPLQIIEGTDMDRIPQSHDMNVLPPPEDSSSSIMAWSSSNEQTDAPPLLPNGQAMEHVAQRSNASPLVAYSRPQDVQGMGPEEAQTGSLESNTAGRIALGSQRLGPPTTVQNETFPDAQVGSTRVLIPLPPTLEYPADNHPHLLSRVPEPPTNIQADSYNSDEGEPFRIEEDPMQGRTIGSTNQPQLDQIRHVAAGYRIPDCGPVYNQRADTSLRIAQPGSTRSCCQQTGWAVLQNVNMRLHPHRIRMSFNDQPLTGTACDRCRILARTCDQSFGLPCMSCRTDGHECAD